MVVEKGAFGKDAASGLNAGQFLTGWAKPVDVMLAELTQQELRRGTAFDQAGGRAARRVRAFLRRTVEGCLCLRVVDRQPWEARAGRWGSGAFAGAFPDLTLRVGELLVALQMPAVLAAPVLASATLDLVNLTASRGQDDRRSLVEFVQALTPERMEQYLALLTALTDWISTGRRPDPADIAGRCQQLEAAAPGGCHFVPAP